MAEKRGKPIKRTLTYMRRMINSGKWKANSRIPTMAKIAEASGTSVPTVRKAVKTLENERLLDNNGSLGFCVVPLTMTKLYATNKQLYYLRLLKSNVDAAEMLHDGGKAIGKFIILNTEDGIQVHNVVSGSMIETTVKEIKDAVSNPVTLAALVMMTGRKLAKERLKYFRQQELRDIAKVILKDRETKNAANDLCG